MHTNPPYSSPEDRAQAYISKVSRKFVDRLRATARRWNHYSECYYDYDRYDNDPQLHMHILTNFYDEGRDLGVLKHYDFVNFANHVYGRFSFAYGTNVRKPDCIPGRIPRKPRRSWGRNYSEPTSYVKQSHHSKKVLSDKEISKREWRKKVKRGTEYPDAQTPRCAQIYKKDGHRSCRRYVKTCLRKGEWLRVSRTLKREFYNPWDWD